MKETILASLQEALELCELLRSRGEANFFRGQSHDWPDIIPSVFRNQSDALTSALEGVEEFTRWSENVPQMAIYEGNEDHIKAIAQHYGLPTPYLDITTSPEIASIFSKSSEPSTEHQSVIYCFSESELEKIPGCRILPMEVDNLWRLEAQQGAFLEYSNAEVAKAVRECAHVIKFPSARLTEAEERKIYPERKSALEVVLDQWFYRDGMETMFAKLTSHSTIVMAARRQTYPGVFAKRLTPELTPDWVGNDPRWVFSNAEHVSVVEGAKQVNLKVDWNGDLRTAYGSVLLGLRTELPNLGEPKQVTEFVIRSSTGKHDQAISTIINRCYDGLRGFPYLHGDIVVCLARTITLALARANGIDPDQWFQSLTGETIHIETSPIGGQIESGDVSKAGFLNCLRDFSDLPLTRYFAHLAERDPLVFMDYVVDPWVLLNFKEWAALYVSQFIPSAIDGYWNSDLTDGEGKLEGFWSAHFNPALLGYVTGPMYRLRSPLSTDKNVENHIYILPDMDQDDLIECFVSCYPRIVDEGVPFKVLFHGYSFDDRPIWRIPEVVETTRMLMLIGGLSPLDVLGLFAHQMGQGEPPKPGEPEGLGAFEIWLIANEKLEWLQGREFSEALPLFEAFTEELGKQNTIFDQLANITLITN